MTSNRPFSARGEVFGDDVVATAIIDRLVHHAEILSLKGDSKRNAATFGRIAGLNFLRSLSRPAPTEESPTLRRPITSPKGEKPRSSRTSMRASVANPERADRYFWLLTADPPVCAGGRPVAVLNQCPRRRKGQICFCRFDAAQIADDLAELGAGELARSLEDGLEPDEVEDFADGVRRSLQAAKGDEDLIERLKALVVRLDKLVDAEVGLTDRYSDDVDP